MRRPSNVASKLKRWPELVVAILLVVLADGWSRQPPERFSAARTVVLDAAGATPERGQAYRISLRRIAPGLTSDRDGVSRIVLLEDGEELAGRALHAHIRERGGGLYSHWGNAILFSSRDGSDPRTNGRRYEVRLPPTTPGWHRGAQIGLLAAALLLLLHWLYGAAGGSLLRAGLWASGGALAIATLALGSALSSSPARELGAVREAVSRDPASVPGPSEPKSAAAGRPRTRHLLRSGDAASFTPGAPLPAARRSRTVTLRPTGGAQRDDGFIELAGGSELHSVEPLEVPASDLESMVLELRAARGASLILRLSSSKDLNSAKFAVEISFAISASPELQTFRFRRPALGAIGNVRSVGIRANSGTGEPPIVRVESLRYSLRLDTFAEQPSGLGPVELKDSLRPALWQSVSGRFSFPLETADGSLLKLAVGALAEPPAEPIDFTVSVVGHGRRSELHRGSVDPRDGWRELALSLPEGDAQELLLEAERLAPRSALLWSGARLIDRRRPPRRLVLILADTLRADALGCYGHEGDPTPSLDALARQGVRFERAFSQTYWTRPSMASIMTGRYVAATGVQTIDQRLPDAYETLAERLADGGFTTVGILTNSNAGPHAGLDQGFDRLRLTLSKSYRAHTDLLIAELALPTLDELDDDDVFLYLHLMEPHAPYGPPEPPAGLRLPAGGSPLPFDPIFDPPWNPRPTAAQRAALYDYDVRSMDRALGELFAHLDQRWRSGDGAPPILAFVSDHGEHLGERDQWGHKFADLYPANVQVPMIIRAPGRIAPGTEVAEPVEIRHLGGTLLDLVGLAPRPAGLDSAAAWRSLLPVLETAAGSATPAFAVSAVEEQDIAAFSLFGRQYGYVARISRDSPRVAVFSDSGLERRVTGHWPRPVLERGALRVRRSYLESQGRIRKRLWAGPEDSAQTIDPQALEHLKALGYID